MRFVGVDVSMTSTGVAILGEGIPPKLYSIKATKDMPIPDRQRKMIAGVLCLLEPGDVVIAEDFGISAQYGGSSGLLAERIEICGALKYMIPGLVGKTCLGCSPQQLKGFICGRQSAHKVEVRAAVDAELAPLGLKTKNSDEADAYALAKVGMGFYKTPDNPKQAKMLEKMRNQSANPSHFDG